MTQDDVDFWPMLPAADRPQWDYVPYEHVGPLRFGMTHDGAVAAMAGFIADEPQSNSYNGVTSVVFRLSEVRPWRAAVTTYFREPDGLYCLAVDALQGPQVTMDGIHLVGRVPSELNGQIIECAHARGFAARILPGCDYGADEFGFVTIVQRAGDFLLTRPIFAIVHSRANTLYDSFPSAEMCAVY